MAAFLDEKSLFIRRIQIFSTPRRLAVRILGLADQQTDLTEDFKGPSKKIALMQKGTFLKQLKDSSVEKAFLTVDDIESAKLKVKNSSCKSLLSVGNLLKKC